MLPERKSLSSLNIPKVQDAPNVDETRTDLQWEVYVRPQLTDQYVCLQNWKLQLSGFCPCLNVSSFDIC